VIQGFWSLYPEPCESNFIRATPKLGFRTITDVRELHRECHELISKNLRYFSSMLPKSKIGEIIQIASQEPSNEQKADKFLQLLSE